MTQPSFVPILEADQVRPSRRLQVPGHWWATRPAEQALPRRPEGKGFGAPGPDQGFALRLARHVADRLTPAPGESVEDTIVGGALLAARRAALMGRAPSVHDVESAFTLFGFLGDAPTDLIAERIQRFRGVAHEDEAQRRLVDSVPQHALMLRASEIADRLPEWRELIGPTDHVE
jgi:hypothetical protein